jgi:hypothetical protein
MQVTNTLNTNEPLHLELNTDFSLQDLDYQKKREKLPIRQASGPHGFGVVTLEEGSDCPVDQEQICVLLGLFKDGKPQKTIFNEDEKDPHNKPSSLSFKHEFEGPNVVEFTVAIRIQMCSTSAQWKSFIIPPDDLIFDSQFDKAEDQNASLSNDTVLSWHLRRNLEHILSVCSIPVGSNISKIQITSGFAETGTKDTPIRTTNQPVIGRDGASLAHDDKPEDGREHPTGPAIKLQAPEGNEDVLHRSAPSQDKLGSVDAHLFKSQTISRLTESENKDTMIDTTNIAGIDGDETSISHKYEPKDEPEHPIGPMIMLQAPDGKEDVLHRSAPSQDRIGPVALTCGDFGDHRISVSGS